MKSALPEKIVNPANAVTSVRILGTIVMIFTAPLSLAFFIVYTICGFSDALDGWIARKANSITEFGSKLDSVADLFFYIVLVLKILHILWKIVPIWFWYLLGCIVALCIVSYTTAALKYRRFTSLHTKMNKVTGLLVFAAPYFLALPFAAEYCCFVVLFGAVSSTEEFVLHLKRREYSENHNSLFAQNTKNRP